MTVQVSASDSQGTMAVLHDVTPPAGGPPLHRHLAETEAFYVIDGRFLFELDGETRIVEAGDSITILPGVVHLYQNIGTTDGKMIIITHPAGLDAFFAELHVLLANPGPPDMGAIAGLHTKFGMDLLGPPLAARS